jgi:hypothetical protein
MGVVSSQISLEFLGSITNRNEVVTAKDAAPA